METNALVAAALAGSRPPTTALSARGGASIVDHDDSQDVPVAAGQPVSAGEMRVAGVRFCDPDLDIVVHPNTTRRFMPSTSLTNRLADRFVVDRASGHLLSAQAVHKSDAEIAAGATVARRGAKGVVAATKTPRRRSSSAMAAAVVKAKATAKGGGSGKVEKPTRAPRINFQRRSWLARTLLYAWAVGEVEYYAAPGATRLVRTCAEPKCLAPGHMEPETEAAREARGPGTGTESEM